jgi:large subunit ribosomal protein L33
MKFPALLNHIDHEGGRKQGRGRRGRHFRPLAGSAAGDGCGRRVRSAALSENQDMAKGKKKLEVIHLVCEETGDQNYTLRRKSGGEKLKVKKYSPRLRKHTLHNEKKK